MKKIALILAVTISIVSCKKADTVPPEDVEVAFSFTHNWDDTVIKNSDFALTQYTNANGETLTISKLVYLISDITFTNSAGEAFDAGDFNLVNVREELNLTFTPNIKIPEGDYNVSFTFGFDNEDNVDAAYPDLNLTAEGGWAVPTMLGGGYHYMRLEGKYINSVPEEVGYQYHTIRANDRNQTPILLKDTSFVVDLGSISIGSKTNIEIEMNVAEWFKNPHTWDLNVLFASLMGNFTAQEMMSENGRATLGTGVFSTGAVTQ